MNDDSNVKRVIRAVSDEAEVFELLREDPDALAERLDLSREEVASLRASDLLVVDRPKNPLVQVTTYTISSGTTCWGTGITLTLDDQPRSLADLDRDRLIEVTERALVDAEYRQRLTDFLFP
jgi:hypothetical protein